MKKYWEKWLTWRQLPQCTAHTFITLSAFSQSIKSMMGQILNQYLRRSVALFLQKNAWGLNPSSSFSYIVTPFLLRQQMDLNFPTSASRSNLQVCQIFTNTCSRIKLRKEIILLHWENKNSSMCLEKNWVASSQCCKPGELEIFFPVVTSCGNGLSTSNM